VLLQAIREETRRGQETDQRDMFLTTQWERISRLPLTQT